MLYSRAMSSFTHQQIIANRREERQRCNDAAARTNAPLRIGYINALRYWGAPLPQHCALSLDSIHACVPKPNMRKRVQGVTFHTFSGKEDYRKQDYERFWVCAPAMAWAQMARHVTIEDLAIIGAALLRRDRRDKVATKTDLERYIDDSPRFAGRAACLAALPYIREGTDSPPETVLLMLLTKSGLGCPTPNYRVEVDNGYRLLDLAYPDCNVGFDYQGAYHADPAQMRADAARFNQLHHQRWTIMQVTADDLRTDESRQRLLSMIIDVVTRQRHLAALRML